MTERETLEIYLKERGLKMTTARETVLAAFMGLGRHVTAELLYEESRKIDPSIGQATVFRTIKLLAESGLASEACRDDGPRQFEPAWKHAHHDHLICIDCGAVVEFSDDGIERAQDAVYAAHGYEPTGHRMELKGRCPKCAKRARRK